MPLLIASIESTRPVFLMVTGVVLLLTAWRLAQSASHWTARTLVSGAVLLGIGYMVMIPLHEAGMARWHGADWLFYGGSATGFAWVSTQLVVMNLGWLLFGTGVALHAHALHSPATQQASTSSWPPPLPSVYESAG